jgi:hypothetical protein
MLTQVLTDQQHILGDHYPDTQATRQDLRLFASHQQQ